MPLPIGTPRKCSGTQLSEFEENIRREVDESLDLLRAHGSDLYDVAASLDVDRKTLTRWRVGANEMPASKLMALRALVDRAARRVGT